MQNPARRPRPAPLPGETLLYDVRGPVWLEASGDVVRKEYDYGDDEIALLQARQEFDRLRRYELVLRPTAGVRSPRAIALIEGDGKSFPAVRMEYCSGENFAALLSQREIDRRALDSILQRIANALCLYVDTFDEAYVNFTLQSLLYDKERDLITLLDFGPWGPDSRRSSSIGFLESSLGRALGMALHSSLGLNPKISWPHRQQRVRAAAGIVVRAEQLAAPGSFDPSELRRVARASYFWRRSRTSFVSQAWHHTGGRMLLWILLRSYRRIAW